MSLLKIYLQITFNKKIINQYQPQPQHQPIASLSTFIEINENCNICDKVRHFNINRLHILYSIQMLIEIKNI